MVGPVESGALEQEIARVGREIADAFPGRRRHPLRALDDKAAEVAARDAELRAALFRFIDVTPACRSLDDLARHLVGFLDQVHEPPGSLAGVRRMGRPPPGGGRPPPGGGGGAPPRGGGGGRAPPPPPPRGGGGAAAPRRR